jgi:predicted transcriptional regulator YdeE
MERFAIIYLEIYDENNNRESGRVEAEIYVWTTVVLGIAIL